MNYKAFQEELCQVLQEKAGDREVVFKQVEKNNGVILDAILIQGKNETILPIIYLEEYYQAYQEGENLETIVKQILLDDRNYKEGVEFQLDHFEDYEKAKTNVFYKLVNYNMNQRMLKRVPHIKYLDLAVVFYYRMDSGCLKGGSVLIHNNNLDTWGITKNQLLEDASFNTVRKMPYSFQGMESLIAELTGEEAMIDSQYEFMYVLSNKEKYFGAAALLYPHVLSHIGSLLKKNFFVIPSSVHECILVPDLGHYTRLELMKMVKEVNQSQLDEDEILSYEVYYYDRRRESLVI